MPLKVGRIVCSADFERVLRDKACAVSKHFAVHRSGQLGNHGLSAPAAVGPQDSVGVSDVAAALRLGLVVPKRYAKRSVTRNLIRRQVRAVMSTCAEQLVGGLWVVRLRAPIDREEFSGASSERLKGRIRTELNQAFGAAIGHFQKLLPP